MIGGEKKNREDCPNEGPTLGLPGFERGVGLSREESTTARSNGPIGGSSTYTCVDQWLCCASSIVRVGRGDAGGRVTRPHLCVD